MEHKYNVDLGYLYGDGAKVPFGESGLSRNRFWVNETEGEEEEERFMVTTGYPICFVHRSIRSDTEVG